MFSSKYLDCCSVALVKFWCLIVLADIVHSLSYLQHHVVITIPKLHYDEVSVYPSNIFMEKCTRYQEWNCILKCLQDFALTRKMQLVSIKKQYTGAELMKNVPAAIILQAKNVFKFSIAIWINCVGKMLIWGHFQV